MPDMKRLEQGYTCGCGQYYCFPLYVFAQVFVDLVHPCGCGRIATIRNTHVVRVEYVPTTRQPQKGTPYA